MRNFHSPGANIDVLAPYDVSAGEGVLVNRLFGIAFGDALTGAAVTIATEGVFSVAKNADDVLSVGDLAFFDSAAKEVRNDEESGSDSLIGLCVEAAGAGATTVRVKLVHYITPIAI